MSNAKYWRRSLSGREFRMRKPSASVSTRSPRSRRSRIPTPGGFVLSRLHKRAFRNLVSPTLSTAAKCSADALSVTSPRTGAAEGSLCRTSYRRKYPCSNPDDQ